MIPPHSTRTHVILLLISDQLVRTVFQEVLEHEGYFVVTSGNLGSAVDRLKEHSVDLLITRTYVSDITGHDAAKYLRTKQPGLQVLIVGGFLEDDRLRYRESLDGFEVFPKPYTQAQLLDKVREVLASAKQLESG